MALSSTEPSSPSPPSSPSSRSSSSQSLSSCPSSRSSGSHSPSSISSTSSTPPPPDNKADSEIDRIAKTVQRLKSELCEPWLEKRATSWGPTPIPDSINIPPSWTGTITTKIGSASHYITCPGRLGSTTCLGRWNRKDRHGKPAGLYCSYGGWVDFDGETIADASPAGGKSLQKLRRLWAEHVLAEPEQQKKKGEEVYEGYSLAGTWEWLKGLWGYVLPFLGQEAEAGKQQEPEVVQNRDLVSIWDQSIVDKVHHMLNKAIAKASSKKESTTEEKEKLLGQGSGGWSGVGSNGVVLKRDAGSRRLADCADRCDLEPGGMWQRGDVEVWTIWNGWSCMVTRDGRFRPGYHLEISLCLWMSVVDFGSTREAYRDRQADWLRATEWLWVNTPPDVPQRVAEVFRSDSLEMLKREAERMRALRPEVYKADDISTTEKRYRCFQDRAGEVIAYHTAGEGMETPRGLVSSWVMIVLNDILDYERDVLCGETNNFSRGLTSTKQVVDTAAWILECLRWSLDNRDHDLTNAMLGTATLYLVIWRYNAIKMVRYKAISVRDMRAGTPPEMEDIAQVVGGPTSSTYGELFDELNKKVRALYGGCTCRTPPGGHDAWQLFADAWDQGGNDDIEEHLHVALVALNNGANAGNVDCECGIDLMLCEGFVHFFHPDTGLVARLHYRSDITELGNTVT
ncbi:hypothetical protein B0T16DRAFT_410704, partial [Cercophora newfieldiana]